MSPLPATRLHIGVIGAGTAGLATAIAFARTGHTVDVFEKHPALATLGAGVLMQPQGVAALDGLGVGAAFNAISQPIERLVGQCERGWTLVDIPYTGLQARAVSRSALGGVLERECHVLGVHLHFGCAVGAIGVENGAGTVDTGGATHRWMTGNRNCSRSGPNRSRSWTVSIHTASWRLPATTTRGRHGWHPARSASSATPATP